MRHWTHILACVACPVVIAAGWFVYSDMAHPVRAQIPEAAQAEHSGILDGMTFSGRVTVDGEPLEVVETWVFSEGTFLSTECALRCDYPRAPYFIREQGEAIEFVSESHCLDKDASIVWRGTIANGTVEGTMSWTISRWYWTIEREFEFAGKLSARTASVTDD